MPVIYRLAAVIKELCALLCPHPRVDSSGYFAGLLISALMIGRIVAVYFWGVVADRYGRRPVIFISLWSTAAFAVAFGFSTRFSWALVFRYERSLDYLQWNGQATASAER